MMWSTPSGRPSWTCTATCADTRCLVSGTLRLTAAVRRALHCGVAVRACQTLMPRGTARLAAVQMRHQQRSSALHCRSIRSPREPTDMLVHSQSCADTERCPHNMLPQGFEPEVGADDAGGSAAGGGGAG